MAGSSSGVRHNARVAGKAISQSTRPAGPRAPRPRQRAAHHVRAAARRPRGDRGRGTLSMTPQSRTSALVDRIRRRTRGGRTLVELLVAIADDATAAQRDRIAAVRVLLEYGFTKPQPDE